MIVLIVIIEKENKTPQCSSNVGPCKTGFGFLRAAVQLVGWAVFRLTYPRATGPRTHGTLQHLKSRHPDIESKSHGPETPKLLEESQALKPRTEKSGGSQNHMQNPALPAAPNKQQQHS